MIINFPLDIESKQRLAIRNKQRMVECNEVSTSINNIDSYIGELESFIENCETFYTLLSQIRTDYQKVSKSAEIIPLRG